MRLFCRAVQKKLLAQMSSKLEEIMHRDFVYCMKLILKEFMLKKNNAKLKNTKKMVKLSQQILVRSYSFADIMTQDEYVAFKIVSCSRSGNFLYGCQKSY